MNWVFMSGVTALVVGLTLICCGAYWSTPAAEPEFRTVALYTNSEGKLALVQWLNGKWTKESINAGGSYINLTLFYTITIEGHPVAQ